MADNIVDSLVIQLGIDADSVIEGLTNAQVALNRFEQKARELETPIDEIAKGFSNFGLLMGGVSGQVANEIMEIGTTSQKASLIAGRAFDAMERKIGGLGRVISGLAAPIASVLAINGLWSGFTKQGEAIDILNWRIGVSTEKIDEWAKANELAGGSQEAFKTALTQFVMSTGRGADEFFRLGEHIEGLTHRQAEFFLQTQGLSAESAAIFLRYRGAANQAAEALKGLGITKEQAERAREFNNTWRQFTWQAQQLGNSLLSKVTPAFEKFVELGTRGLKFFNDNLQFTMLVLSSLAAFIGAGFARNIIKGAQSIGLITSIIAKALPVIRAFNIALLTNPIFATVAAIVALALAIDDLIYFAKGGGSAFEEFLRWLGWTSDDIDAFRNAIQGIGSIVGTIVGFVSSVLKEFFNDLFVKFLGGILKIVLTAVQGVLGALMLPIKLLLKIPDLFNSISSGLKKLKEDFKNFSIIDWIFEGLTNGLQGALNLIVEYLVNPVRDFFKDLFDFSKYFKGNPFSDWWSKAKGNVSEFFDTEDESGSQKPKSHPVNGYVEQTIVAATSGAKQIGGVTNDMKVTVENHITTADNPQDIANAVNRGVDRSMGRAQTMISNAATGVVQKG